jgi:aldehyde:ferredoxin oxidoreductase
MHGWMNKILQVDLSNKKITTSPSEQYIEKYIGGRGIASRIYAETVSPAVKAFDPENQLILMNGALVATGTPGANGMEVVGKSPGPSPEGYCFGNINGFLGAELKKAGYDGIVLTGRADRPVYLWINDDKVELRDATEFWGQGAYRTGERLQQIHGDKTRFLATGVAGERLVRTAVALASHNSTISAGFGAVMGSKNFKALVVKGTGKVSLADPEKVKQLNRYTLNISKRFAADMPPGLRNVEIVRKGGACHQCALECVRNVYRYGQREDLVGNYRCQSMVYYLPWTYGREDEPVETLFHAPILANDYGIETFELEHVVNWLYDCYREGILTELETGLPLSKIGTREFLEKLLHSIAYREGFGDILAEGLWRAGGKVSKEARAMIKPVVGTVGVREVFSPRMAVVLSLLYQMEPRGNPSIFHEVAQIFGGWMIHQHRPDVSPITTKTIHDIARAFWGSSEAGNFTSYEGKALAAKKIQDRTYLKDSLGLCDFSWPMMYSLNTPDHLGDPDLEAKTFMAVTGISGDKIDLGRCGERLVNLQRIILLREGRKLPEADFPYEWNFTEALIGGVHGGKTIVPGPGDDVIDVTGNRLDNNKFTNILKEYYRLRGWDEDSGFIRNETLTGLDLDKLAAAFPEKGVE